MLTETVDTLLNRVDTSKLYPAFVERLRVALAACLAQGVAYYCYSGFRSYEEQDALYKKKLAGGPHANPPGLSQHQYGGAVDLAPDKNQIKPGLQPSWNVADFKLIALEAKKAGLVAGGDWGDWPHIQIPYFVRSTTMRGLRDEWVRRAQGGMSQHGNLRATWKFYDGLPIFKAA